MRGSKSMKTMRQHLNEYDRYVRTIELAGVAITAVEGMPGSVHTEKIVAALKCEQQRALPKMDAAAAALGAPYPSNA